MVARQIIVLAAALAALSAGTGCAICDDPHQGGFVSGISNLASGCYVERVAEREGTLEEEQTQGTVLQDRAAEIQRQRDRVQADLAAARSRLDELDRDLAALRRRLEEAQARQPVDPAHWAMLRDAEGKVLLASARIDQTGVT
ncbi:MAG: hypothetical protein V3R98_04395, partial [Alphaproteobacteria bacterium]